MINLGIVLGVFGSTFVAVGMNIQAMGTSVDVGCSQLSIIGFTIFIAAALVNFVAFAFAPATVIAPLEAIQFVSNLIWNKLVNRVIIGLRVLLGTALIIVGLVLAVMYGPRTGGQGYSIALLESYWAEPGWITFFAVTLLVVVVAEVTHYLYKKRAAEGQALWMQEEITMVSYLLGTSLISAQSVTFAKCMAEALEAAIAGTETPEADPPTPRTPRTPPTLRPL